jgi:hypothetical protein
MSIQGRGNIVLRLSSMLMLVAFAFVSIEVRVLFLIGDHEVIYKPVDAIQRATRLVPNLKAEIIANANHIAESTNVMVINQRIGEFFSASF